METWRISFDWREDANKGEVESGTMDVQACCVSQALSEYESRRPVNARVRAVWALGEEARIRKGSGK